MVRQRFFLKILFFLIFIPTMVWASSGSAGISAFDFLEISPIARATAMGGAYAALGNDIGSIYYNPAGLADILTTQVDVTYLDLYQNISDEFFAFAYPLKPKLSSIGGTFAAALNLIQTGSFPRLDDFGNNIGSFTSGMDEFMLAYAKSLGSRVQFGLTAKFLNQQIDQISQSAFAMDIGTLILPPVSGMRIGLAIQNLGGTVNNFNLPCMLLAAVSYRKYDLFSYQDDGAFTVQTTVPIQPVGQTPEVQVGAEYNYKLVGQRFSLRGGYQFLNNSLQGIGMTLGAGYGVDFNGAVVFIDYAFEPAGVFGNSNRISLITKF